MTNLQLIISQIDIRRLPIVDKKGQMVGFTMYLGCSGWLIDGNNAND